MPFQPNPKKVKLSITVFVCEGNKMLLTVNSLNSPRQSLKLSLPQLLRLPSPPHFLLLRICWTYLCVKLFRKKNLTSKAPFTSFVFFKKNLKTSFVFPSLERGNGVLSKANSLERGWAGVLFTTRSP